MSEGADFIAVEARLAAHLRNPAQVAPPDDVDPARVAIYARLVFHNVESLLGGCFPLLRGARDEAGWHALVRGFLVAHRARTPLFPRLPQEFASYVAGGRSGQGDPAWLAELADYEWLLLECAQDPREIDELVPPLIAENSAAQLLDGLPVLNPLARVRRYGHAVHATTPGRVPDTTATPVWLVVFRHRDDSVCHLQLNAVTARLVELLARGAVSSGRELLLQIAEELSHPRPAQLLESGRAVLAELRERGLLLGTVAGT